VVLSRADVRFVVTEYGIADLFAKSIRERVIALAEIAHPDFRNDILKAAKERKYVFPYQKDLPTRASRYPKEYTVHKAVADGTRLLFRPIKPTDNKLLRDMCYSLSEQSIAFRFFTPVKAFPHKFIQDFTNIDYSKDMAIGALIQDTGGEQIVGVGHYYLNQAANRAEVSFLVRDDWQAKGIGTYLLEIITEIAKKRGIAGFEASVLAKNNAMLSVFYNSGYKISTKKEDEMYVISYDLKER